MHWKMAECSESAGRIFTPYFLASGTMWGPAEMSVSLLARQMFLPAAPKGHTQSHVSAQHQHLRGLGILSGFRDNAQPWTGPSGGWLFSGKGDAISSH